MSLTPNPERRHEDADTRDVTVERSDAIDAVAGLMALADKYRRDAKSRRNAGAGNAHARKYLRDAADVYDAAALRIQRASDNAY